MDNIAIQNWFIPRSNTLKAIQTCLSGGNARRKGPIMNLGDCRPSRNENVFHFNCQREERQSKWTKEKAWQSLKVYWAIKQTAWGRKANLSFEGWKSNERPDIIHSRTQKQYILNYSWKKYPIGPESRRTRGRRVVTGFDGCFTIRDQRVDRLNRHSSHSQKSLCQIWELYGEAVKLNPTVGSRREDPVWLHISQFSLQ
jgi:hypothetical protein